MYGGLFSVRMQGMEEGMDVYPTSSRLLRSN